MQECTTDKTDISYNMQYVINNKMHDTLIKYTLQHVKYKIHYVKYTRMYCR